MDASARSLDRVQYHPIPAEFGATGGARQVPSGPARDGGYAPAGSPARPDLDGATLLVRRLKPRLTAPACHVESPIDDFLLPLSPRRVRVFMHTRTEVRIHARRGRWLGTEETSLNARVLASCDGVDRRRCLHERCGRWGQMGETRRGTLLPLNGDGIAARRARQVFLFNGRCSGAAKDLPVNPLSDHGKSVPKAPQVFVAGRASQSNRSATTAPIGVTGERLPAGLQRIGPQRADRLIAFARLLAAESGGFVPLPALP